MTRKFSNQLFRVSSALLVSFFFGCTPTSDLDAEILNIAASGQTDTSEDQAADRDANEVALWKKEPMLEYSRDSGSGSYTFLLTRTGYAGLQVVLDGTRATYVSRLSEPQVDRFLSLTRSIMQDHDTMFEQGNNPKHGTSVFAYFGRDGEVDLKFSVIHDSKRESEPLLSLKSLIVRTLVNDPWVRFDRALDPG